MKRSKTTDTKHNKKQKLSTKCKILDTIENIKRPRGIIQTPCGKFLIGVEGFSIYKYCLKTKQKFRIAGSVCEEGHQDGTRDESRFNYPEDLTLSKDLKTLFVSDRLNRVIRGICVVTGVTTTFAGQVDVINYVDGPKEKACFKYPKGLKLSPDGNTLIVSDSKKLRTICIATGQVNTIDTFDTYIVDFALSPDGKHVIILNSTQILKYNLETGKAEIVSVLEDKGYFSCEISKDRLLFISNMWSKEIKVVNLVTNKIINTITINFKPNKITVSTNGKQLYINTHNKIQVLDISKYCTNFKTFLQSQFLKYSFLPRAVVKRFSI